MTDLVERNNYHSYALGPCAGCGCEDWVHTGGACTLLCFDCRKGTNMQAITIQPPNAEAIKPHSQAITEYLCADARAFVLETDEDLQLAANIINDIKQRAGAVEELRQSVSKPLNTALRMFNSFFKPFSDSADEARALWDGKIRALLTSREEARRAAEAELQKVIATQNAPAATAAIQAFQPAPRAVGLITQDAWEFEEFNHSIVPAELTTINRAAVMAEIKRQLAEGNAQPAIPGCKVFKRQVIKAAG